MILNFQKITTISLVLLFFGCSKDIDISEFSDDFTHYEPELRIEALILPGDNTALVRIDKSVLITDTDLYDCIDNDFGIISQDSCNTLNGTWHGTEEDLAPCGDWDILYDDLGIDGKTGDPTDEDEDCVWGADEDDPCFTEPSAGENNGIPDCNEPHVDETDEIITQLHIDNCTVSMSNSSGAICNFKYDQSAGSHWYFPYDREKDDLDFVEESFYGGYIPDESCIDKIINNEFSWNDYVEDYEFECNCGSYYGKIVSKEPIQISPPVVFFNESDMDNNNDGIVETSELANFLLLSGDCIDNECLKDKSTLWNDQDGKYEKRYFARYAGNDFIYYSSLMPYVYFEGVQYFYDSDNDRYILLHGHLAVATTIEGIHENITTMKEGVVTDLLTFENSSTVNKYYYEIFTFSESYKNYYIFDQLDLLDPERTNLRKLNSNDEPTGMVMGAFGSITSEKIYFEIIDCEEYETQGKCENENITKSVCKWYADGLPGTIDPLCFSKKLP